jgi:hypothetical protein
MAATFRATHEVTITDSAGKVRKEKLMTVDGVPYTHQEWNNGSAPDWGWGDDGEFEFQGLPAGFVAIGGSVEVRKISG